MVQDVTGKPDLQFPTGHASERPGRTGVFHTPSTETSVGDDTGTVDRANLEQAVAKVREAVRTTESKLQIEIDPDLDRVVVKILQGESGEVIRQIPPQEFLDLAKQLSDPKGLLLKERA